MTVTVVRISFWLCMLAVGMFFVGCTGIIVNAYVDVYRMFFEEIAIGGFAPLVLGIACLSFCDTGESK